VTVSAVAQRILDALGDAFGKLGGPNLPLLVDGLASPLVDVDERLTESEGGWAAAFDVDTTPDPWWLGEAIGAPVPADYTLEQARAFLQQRPAWRRGTIGAMQAAVAALLVGEKRFAIAERDTSPWHATITVFSADVPAGVTVADILAAATTQKPVGIVLAAQIVTHATYAHFHDPTTHGGTYASVAAAFPTYADRSVHAPEGGTTP
jgi:hypothetical protein